MRRVLLDENTPEGVRRLLPGLLVATAPAMGWASLANGALLTVAEQAGFDVLVMGDQNMEHQNRLAGRGIAVVVLGTIHWPTIRAYANRVAEAVARAAPGRATAVAFPRPPHPRRPSSRP